MPDSDDDYTPFDEVNDFINNHPKPATPNKGKHEVFRMYDSGGKLLYISRSAQLHKLKDREFWPKVTSIQINRHTSPGAAEDDKITGIEQEKPLWNVMNAGL